MQTLTFSCPLCGRRMGVGIELIGRPVRCPHCRQVIIAPSTGNRGGPAAPDAVPNSPSPASAPTPPDPQPGFKPPARKEAAESIFGNSFDSDEESVFGKSQVSPNSELRDEPESGDATHRVVQKSDFMSIVETPLAGGRTDNFKAPILDSNPKPFLPPPIFPPEKRKVELADGQVNPFQIGPTHSVPKSGDPVNPWTRLDSAPPVIAPLLPLDASSADTSAAMQPLRWLLIAVSLYAIVITGLAIWGWLRVGDRGHPLLFIPDVFGEYRKASRDRVSDLRQFPQFDQPVPPELRVKLGQTLSLGDLQVEPLAIEERRVVRVTEFTTKFGETVRQPSRNPCLVLRLKIRNQSNDVALHPLDPAFNRASVPGLPVPLTGLTLADGRRFMGSSIHWPFTTGYKRIYYEGQESDDELLFPGRERQSVIVSADLPHLTEAVRSQKERVTWNVHIRRGLTTLHWDDYSVAALFAVEFEPNEVAVRNES